MCKESRLLPSKHLARHPLGFMSSLRLSFDATERRTVIDNIAILFSTVMVVLVIVRAAVLDRTRPGPDRRHSEER